MFGDNLHFSSCKGEIIIDSPKELYFSGEHVTGTYIVTARSSITASRIFISLRCDENAYVHVGDSNGGHYEHHQERLVSIENTVFPEHAMLETEGPLYTMAEGTHAYKFDFEIPMGPQSVPNKPYKSSTGWYIKGVVHRGSNMSKAIRTICPINVCPDVKTPLDLNQMTEKTETAIMKVYPGQEHINESSKRLRDLLPFHLTTHKHVEVTCSLKVPDDGIPQAPAAIPIKVDVRSDNVTLLCIKKFELDLKYKLDIKVRDHVETDRDLINVVKMDEINLPVKEGLARIHQKLSHVSIDKLLPATFKTENFDLSYKLVGYFFLTSRVSRGHVKIVRVSAPAVVRYKSDSSGETPPYISNGSEHILLEKEKSTL